MPERPFVPSDKLKRLIDCDNALLLVMNLVACECVK